MGSPPEMGPQPARRVPQKGPGSWTQLKNLHIGLNLLMKHIHILKERDGYIPSYNLINCLLVIILARLRSILPALARN
jgi:hypothetical protein